MRECTAVTEGDQLCEGIGALRATEEGGVSTLGADEGCCRRLDWESWEDGGC